MAFGYVQSTSQRVASGNNALAFGGSNSVGNLLLCGVMFEDETTTVSTLTDSKTNTWTSCGAIKRSGGGFACSVQLFYAKNAGAGANTVTMAPSVSVTSSLIIHEYSGGNTSAPLDQFASAADIGGLTSTAQTGTLTTTAAGELLFACAVSNRILTADAGFSLRSTAAFNVYFSSEDQVLGGAGGYVASEVLQSQGSWVIAAASFLAVAAGGSPSRGLTLLGVG